MARSPRIFWSLLWLVGALLCRPAKADAASVTIVLPKVQAAASAEIPCSISVRGAQGLGPLQLELVFEPARLRFVRATAGSGPGVGLFDFNLLGPGRLKLVMTGDPNQPIQGDGEICTVVFQAVEGASGESPLQAEKARAWEQTAEALEMRVAVEPGSVTLATRSRSLWPWGAGALGLGLIFWAWKSRLGRSDAGLPELAPAPAAAGGRFCGQCGARLSPTGKFCPACGRQTPA